MANKKSIKKPIKDGHTTPYPHTSADQYEKKYDKKFRKAVQLPNGNDKTVYRKDLYPNKPVLLTPSNRISRGNEFAPKNPWDPNVPPDIRRDYSAKNKRKKPKGMKA